jgi:hypothetical protein
MTKKELSTLQRFFIWCSGADIELLMTCTRPVVMKYVQLGFLILIPSFFAFISASYMLSTVFVQGPYAVYIALGGGLFWGIVIFSLDRFLVMTYNKSKNVLRDLFSISVFSRMALAILVGYVVAHPMVIKMFEPNIKHMLHERYEVEAQKIAKQHDEKISAVNGEITTLTDAMAKLGNSGPALQACGEDPELQSLITTKQAEISTAQLEHANELAGNGGSRTKKDGEGPVARAIKARIVSLEQQLGDLQARLESTRTSCEINRLELIESANADKALRETQRQQLKNQFEEKQGELAELKMQKQAKLDDTNKYATYDFLTMSNGLDELAQQKPNVMFWKKLLTAVMWVVDLSAILMKLTCKLDEYDSKKQADEFYRLREIDIQLRAHQDSEELRLQNARQKYKDQAAWAEVRQQAAHNLQRLQDTNVMLAKIVETSNEFPNGMSLLQIRGKIPANDAEYKAMLDDYQRVVWAASKQLIEAALP